MNTVDNTQQINPHMKLAKPLSCAVVPPAAIYQYSLHDELLLGENQYRQILNSMNRSRLAIISEKHPNLKSNIFSVIKFTLGVATAGLALRYRHSLPVLKSMCKKPKKTPPTFLNDIEKIWQSIVKK